MSEENKKRPHELEEDCSEEEEQEEMADEKMSIDGASMKIEHSHSNPITQMSLPSMNINKSKG